MGVISLGNYLRQTADQFGEKGIVHIHEKGETFQSYTTLLLQAEQFAVALQRMGYNKGDTIILSLDHSYHFVIAFWGCILAGVVPAPMPAIDITNTETIQAKRLLKACHVLKAPIVCDAGDQLSYGLLKNITVANNVNLLIAADLIKEGDIRGYSFTYRLNTLPDDLAVIQFSSGSTGNPKGVQLSHRNIITNVTGLSTRMHTKETGCMVSWLPLYHDFGLFGCHIRAIVAGLDQVMIAPKHFIKNPLVWLKAIQQHKGTITASTTTGLQLLIKKMKTVSEASFDLSSLQYVCLGAEHISLPVCQEFTGLLAPFGVPASALFPGYGLAEATLVVTASTPGETIHTKILDRNALYKEGKVKFLSATSSAGLPLIAAGTPIADFTIHITDDPGNRLPNNTIGEITVQGNSVTSGYINNNEATVETIKDGVLYTGDIGFIDDNGRLFITGRKKELIKKNGVNYFPSDIEDAVWNTAGQSLKQVIACGWQNIQNSKEELLVFIVPQKTDTTQALIASIKKGINEIIGFPPDHIISIKSNQVPRTSSAKIIRSQLVQSFQQGIFYHTTKESIAMNATTVATTIEQIWREALELPASCNIDPAASFFSLGGDSIRSVKTIALLEEAFHFKLETNFIYRYPSINDQCRFIAGRDMHITPPSNELELILRDLIAHCISAPKEKVGTTKNIVELVAGFDDVLKIQDAICTLFNLKNLPPDLFKRPTIRDLALYLQQNLLHEPESGNGITTFPLMNFQETLYYHSKSFLRNEPTGLSCYIIYRIPVYGSFIPELYNKAFNHLVVTHPMLRTVIYEDGDRPGFTTLQQVPEIKLTYRDITDLTKEEQQLFLQDRDKEDHHHRFDCTQYPLFYTKAYKLSDQHHELVIHIDHQLVDGYSFVQLVKELFESYDELCSGMQPTATAVPATFRDYVFIEKLREQLPGYQRSLEFALNVFRDLPAKIILPYKQDPARITNIQFDTHHTTISAEIMQGLVKISDQHDDINLNSLLLACYFRLMNIWTNERDLIINMPIYNREHHFPVAGKVIGSFLDIFPVRIKISEGDSIIAMARKCEKFIRALLEYPVSSIELTRRIAEREGLKHGSLSNIIFSNSINMIRKGTMSGLKHVQLGEPVVHTGAPGTVIDLVLYTWEGKWCFDWNYVTGLLHKEQITTMADQYHLMLLQTVASYNAKGIIENYAGTHLIPPGYRNQLARINETAATYPVIPIHEWVTTQAAQTPHKTAITFEKEKLTFRELNEAANQFAHILIQSGVSRNTFVALIHSRSIDLLIAQLGVLKAGAAYVPIDPNYPPERIGYMLTDCGASIVITQSKYAPLIAGVQRDNIKYCIVTDKEVDQQLFQTTLVKIINRNMIAVCPVYTPLVSSNASDLMYMIYTSGSTGEPKGVMVTHKNACNFLYYVQQAFAIRPSDRIALVTSYSFDMTITSNWVALLTGASLHILCEEKTKDIEQLLHFLQDEQITFLNVTPSHFSLLVNTLEILQQPLHLQKEMTIMLGAEIINPNDLNNWLKHFPTHRFINEYGPTETTVASTFFPIPVSAANKVVLPVIPIGKPIYNTQVYILDDNKAPCMPGVPGTLYIGGDGVTKGYLNKQEKTGKAFIPNPLTNDPGDIVYNTGDLAKFTDDGNIIFLGRKDHQINLRGYRVELGDIEAAMTGFEGVAEACAALQKDKNDQPVLVGFYTSRSTEALSHKQLAAHLANKLPEHMIPVAFQQIAKIPINTNGKLDRRMLPLIAVSGKNGFRSDYVAPRSEIEAKMTGIWEDVLSVPGISIHENFWETGGDSIRSVRLIQKIREAGFHTVKIRDIFNHPTVAAICRALGERHRQEDTSHTDTVILKNNNDVNTTLFCLPYAAGNPGMFAEFARRLPDQYQVIGAQYSGHGDGRQLLSSVEAYADRYVDELYRSTTPIILLGYSFGGYVAYDLCKKLEGKGKKINGLILVGTTPPGAKDELMQMLSIQNDNSTTAYIQKSITEIQSANSWSDDETSDYIRILKADTMAMLNYHFGEPMLKTPALFLTGTDEEHIIKSKKEKWRECITHCSFKELPGDHLLIKSHALQLAQAVTAFAVEVIKDKEAVYAVQA
jgi:polyketide synthase PksJ